MRRLRSRWLRPRRARHVYSWPNASGRLRQGLSGPNARPYATPAASVPRAVGSRRGAWRSPAWCRLRLPNLNRGDAVVPVIAARPRDIVEIWSVGGQRRAVAGVVVLVVNGDGPAARDADRRDAVVPIRACATTARQIVEVGCAGRECTAIASEVRVLVDDDRRTRRRRRGVVVAPGDEGGKHQRSDEATRPVHGPPRDWRLSTHILCPPFRLSAALTASALPAHGASRVTRCRGSPIVPANVSREKPSNDSFRASPPAG